MAAPIFQSPNFSQPKRERIVKESTNRDNVSDRRKNGLSLISQILFWVRSLAHPAILTVGALAGSACVAPVVTKHKVGDSFYATVYGTYFFYGLGGGGCAVHSIDDEDLGFPYPYGAKVTPGKHRVTFWCDSFFFTASDQTYLTYEFNAVAGHSYKLSFLKDGLIDLATGDEIPEQQ